MKIIYNIAGFYRPAGMERVLANKVNYWSKKGYEVVVVTTDQRGRDNVFQLPSTVRTIDIGINYEENNGTSLFNKVFHYPFKQFKHRKRLVEILRSEHADIVVSMFCNDASFLPRIKDGSKKILEIHFSRFKRLQYGRKGLWAFVDKLRSYNDLRTVKRFDKFIVLTKEDRDYWGNLSNICVIPNARSFKSKSPALLDKQIVIAVGRYNNQKNFESLLEIWSKTSHVGWKLWIVGDGEERENLQQKIQELSIGDSVILGKAESDMINVYKNASIMALSSRYEGLPMVLLEAQALGLPIVSYKCKCGPKDVITDGVDGFLIAENDQDDFSEKLSKLMSDYELRKTMGNNAYMNSERFDETLIMNKWDDLFNSLLQDD